MGQKVHPIGLRVGVNKNWLSRWTAADGKQFSKWVCEDEKIRNYFINTFKTAEIVNIEIERKNDNVNVSINCGQPPLITGTDNADLPKNILAINKIVGRKMKIHLNIIKYINTSWSARVVAREIADAIEIGTPFRSAQKNAVKKVMMSGCKGIKTRCSGRLGGVEMARVEGYSEGVIPLSTLRADLDYALEVANTTMGAIGCKVWINRGEILNVGLNNQITPIANKPREFRPNNRGGFNKNNNFNKSNTNMQNKGGVK